MLLLSINFCDKGNVLIFSPQSKEDGDEYNILVLIFKFVKFYVSREERVLLVVSVQIL